MSLHILATAEPLNKKRKPQKKRKKKKDKWIVFSLNKIGDLRNNIYIFTVESILISCSKHRLSIS